MASTPTLRRLNDRERYWALTWPEWAALLAGGGLMYLAVEFSPLSTKATVSIALFVLLAGVMVVMGVSGQALSPGRQLRAITGYRSAPKLWCLAEKPDRRGMVLDRTPFSDQDHGLQSSETVNGFGDLDRDLIDFEDRS
jgi:hypothetical protein